MHNHSVVFVFVCLMNVLHILFSADMDLMKNHLNPRLGHVKRLSLLLACLNANFLVLLHLDKLFNTGVSVNTKTKLLSVFSFFVPGS